MHFPSFSIITRHPASTPASLRILDRLTHLHLRVESCARSLDISTWSSGIPVLRLLVLRFGHVVLVFTSISVQIAVPASPVARRVVPPCVSHRFLSFCPFQLHIRPRCASSTGSPCPPSTCVSCHSCVHDYLISRCGAVVSLPRVAVTRFCPRFGPFILVGWLVYQQEWAKMRTKCISLVSPAARRAVPPSFSHHFSS
jgi:hypothetical protein